MWALKAEKEDNTVCSGRPDEIDPAALFLYLDKNRYFVLVFTALYVFEI